MSFCIELFCVVTLQYQILVRIAIAYFIIEKKKDDLIYNYGIIRCKKSEFNTVSPDDYVCCRETNLSVECLIHDKVAAKKRYQNLIIDKASIEDIMLFYIKGGVK